MSSHPGPRDRRRRLWANVRAVVAIGLFATVVAIVFFAPADASTPTSIPVGLALSASHHPVPNALGDRQPKQERGIAWAAGKPRAALELSAVVLAALLVDLVLPRPRRRRRPRRLDAPWRRRFVDRTFTRGPPASFARP